jgi:hypothetical protein
MRRAPAVQEESDYQRSVFLNEVLIQVRYLINEASITQRMPSDVSAIEYYHIDLGTPQPGHVMARPISCARSRWSGVRHWSDRTPLARMLQRVTGWGSGGRVPMPARIPRRPGSESCRAPVQR